MGDGRRDRRRQETQQRIVGAAMRLFFERGFDAVTVAQVAEAADVAEKTVFNYFPTKADLVFDPGDDLVEELRRAVRVRPDGEPVVDAMRRFRLAAVGPAGSGGPTREFLELVAASPALQAHRRAVFARWEAELADELARATGAAPGSFEPFVVAAALMAVLRAPFELGVADTDHRGALAALELLRGGLADYAPAAPSGGPRPSAISP